MGFLKKKEPKRNLQCHSCQNWQTYTHDQINRGATFCKHCHPPILDDFGRASMVPLPQAYQKHLKSDYEKGYDEGLAGEKLTKRTEEFEEGWLDGRGDRTRMLPPPRNPGKAEIYR